MTYQQFDLPQSLLKMTLFCISSKKQWHWKVIQKTLKTHHFQNTIKTNEISTFAFPGLDLSTTTDDQNHHKGPPEASPDTPREPSVFPIPFGTSPRPLRTSWGPPGDPQGRQKDTQGTTKDPQGLRKDAQGPPRDLQGPPTTPERPQGSPKKPSKSLKNHKTKPHVQTNHIIPKTSWLLTS